MIASNQIMYDDDGDDEGTCIMLWKTENGGFLKWLCNYNTTSYKTAKYAFAPNEASFWIVAFETDNIDW